MYHLSLPNRMSDLLIICQCFSILFRNLAYNHIKSMLMYQYSHLLKYHLNQFVHKNLCDHLHYSELFAKEYLDCIREELPHEATTGFRFRTITQDPAVRKAVDDIVFDLYGEENPCNEEDYNLAPSEEIQMGGM